MYKVDGEKNFRWDYVRGEYLIRFIDGDEIDWYIIQEPQGTKNSTVTKTITCPHISTLLKNKNIYLEFDDENGIGTLPELAAKILAGTGWTVGRCDVFVERGSQIEKVRSLKDNSHAGAYSLVSKMCGLFNAYPRYNGNTKTVDFFALDLNNKEWEFVVGNNLDSMTVKHDTSSIVTRLYVEGEYGDFGYVGIENAEANTSKLNCIMNFDYYRDLGLFTADHQTAVLNYMSDAKNTKEQISSYQASLNTYIDQAVQLIGSAPCIIYRLNSGSITGTKYQINSPTDEPGPGDEVIGVVGYSSYETTTWQSSGSYPSRFTHIIWFQTPPLGSIGVKQAAITAAETQITGWERKIAQTTDEERIASYQANIAELQSKINTIYTETNGLYQQMYNLVSIGSDINLYTYRIGVQQERLDNIEATFLAAMGDMLRDGRWSDENYAPGQEDALYADALDISERVSKPKTTYTMAYKDASEALGHGIEDMELNQTGHIWDEELGVNDYGYIKSLKIVHDNIQDSKVEITTDDGYSKQVSLESVLTRIAQMAELLKAKNGVYERAGALKSSGQLAAERLEGMIDVMRNKLSSAVSNWYTDDSGNIIFESLSGTGAMMLCGEGFMIAAGKTPGGDWDWRTKTCHWFSV